VLLFCSLLEDIISRIVIDGYNLIGTSHESLEKQRKALIDSIVEYRKTKGHSITIVFDGWKTGTALEQRTTIGGVNIIFSRLGEKADSVIKRLVSSFSNEWIVVTSDREVADAAWSEGSVPVKAEDFQSVLDGELTNDITFQEYQNRGRKGNPRQPSRKEKAVRRALLKL
jgi:uncharacterized protein